VQIFFHAISRGKQCVANCAGFFFVQLKMKKESLTAWTSVDLDNILCCGDYLYKEIYKACRLQGDYLHPSNIPCHLQWENVVFGYKIMSLCSGMMHPGYEGCLPFLSLENAFARECNSSSQFIFIAAGNAIGLYFDGNVFYTFDSHARDDYGLGCPVGKCVLGCLPNIVNLCTYLRGLCASTCGTSHDLLQYDLHKIMFSTMSNVLRNCIFFSQNLVNTDI
jgi:hypothetical protein